MTDLVFLESNKVDAEPYTTSKVISVGANIRHDKIKASIEKHQRRMESFGKLTSYGGGLGGRGNESGYRLSEEQASFLVTLLKNTENVLDFKQELVRQFFEMRRLLLERQTAEWQQVRLHSKAVRMQETDAIKALVEYAKAQGSEHADKLYLSYSKLVKSLVGYENRDFTDTEALVMILSFERILHGIITAEMLASTHYKAIYQKAKAQLVQIKTMWAVPKLTA